MSVDFFKGLTNTKSTENKNFFPHGLNLYSSKTRSHTTHNISATLLIKTSDLEVG